MLLEGLIGIVQDARWPLTSRSKSFCMTRRSRITLGQNKKKCVFRVAWNFKIGMVGSFFFFFFFLYKIFTWE